MRIRGEGRLFVALSFEAGCQVVVGLSERHKDGAIEGLVVEDWLASGA